MQERYYHVHFMDGKTEGDSSSKDRLARKGRNKFQNQVYWIQHSYANHHTNSLLNKLDEKQNRTNTKGSQN
jgi:hypothetical protein